MKLIKSSLTILLIVCTPILSPQAIVVSQHRLSPLADTGKLYFFEQFVKNQMEKDKIPGLTIGFIKDDQTWVKGFGIL